ncbi:hypothetical protein [Acetobacterium wieringae]|uniref:hypothetical protein n=1 Tax=Acetobacterium wieringae TaxID=52694 RepID=UPI002B21D3D8|nr:hypothetical protein [Acetobacterium wieringae]MEA4805121.1 hypothetical protein [Acetobacterium wieringae]
MIEIKTISSSNVSDFDNELQTCLNEGWVMVGQIRTVPFAENRWSENEKEVYCMHYATFKKGIYENTSVCGTCDVKEHCHFRNEAVISGSTITSCPYYKPGESNE